MIKIYVLVEVEYLCDSGIIFVHDDKQIVWSWAVPVSLPVFRF